MCCITSLRNMCCHMQSDIKLRPGSDLDREVRPDLSSITQAPVKNTDCMIDYLSHSSQGLLNVLRKKHLEWALSFRFNMIAISSVIPWKAQHTGIMSINSCQCYETSYIYLLVEVNKWLFSNRQCLCNKKAAGKCVFHFSTLTLFACSVPSTDVFICTSPIKHYKHCPYEKVGCSSAKHLFSLTITAFLIFLVSSHLLCVPSMPG